MRSWRVIGARRTRSASSAALGGGSWARATTAISISGAKTRPEIAGIHFSSTFDSSSTLPTDLATPDDRMKLAHSMAPSTSVRRRPSRKPNTRPQIMPRHRPFRYMAIGPITVGSVPNSKSAICAPKIRVRMAMARWLARISEITLTPMNLAVA